MGSPPRSSSSGSRRRRLRFMTEPSARGATPLDPRHAHNNTRERAQISFVLGDITEQEVDAVVNAANSSLMGGGGVDGAIHRKGGPEILAECKRIRAERFPDGLPTGMAVATTAGELLARWVVHTVGPVFSKSEDRSEQ